MDEEKNQLQKDYEDKISQLQRDIEKEQESNAKAAAEMENLRQFYQDELLKIDSSSASSDREKVVDDQGDTQEILKKLKDIEANLVGGEMVHDRQIQERYKKKKNQWEERRKLVAQVLAKADDEDGVLLRVYDDIQDEVRIKSEFIKKYKQKVLLTIFHILFQFFAHHFQVISSQNYSNFITVYLMDITQCGKWRPLGT